MIDALGPNSVIIELVVSFTFSLPQITFVPLRVRRESRTCREEKCFVRACVAFLTAIALCCVDGDGRSRKRPSGGIAPYTASFGLTPSGPIESLTAFTAI